MLPEVDLSPKGIGALLDDAVVMYRANARTLAIGSAVAVLPVALVMSIASVWYANGVFEVLNELTSFDRVESLSGSELVLRQLVSTVATAAVPLYFLARWFLMAAVVTAGPAILYGVRIQPKALLGPGWRNGAGFIGAQVLVSLSLTGLAIPAFIVAGVVPFVGFIVALALTLLFVVRLSLVSLAVVTEQRSVGAAFKRSWALTRKRFWRTVGFFLSLSLLTYAVGVAIQSPAIIHTIVSAIQSPDAVFEPTSVGWKVLEGLLAGIATSIVVPFTALAWYRYYLDLRSRNEGMDLLVRADALAEETSR